MVWDLMENYYTSNADRYKGTAERCTFEFDYQAEWLGSQSGVQQLINSCIQSVESNGGIPLQITIYRDQDPILTTKYMVIVTAYDPTADYSGGGIYTSAESMSGEPIVAVAPVLIFLAWAGIIALFFAILAISAAHVINAISNVDFEGVAKATASSMWWILAVSGLLVVGGLLTASGRRRYSEAGEWIRRRGKEEELTG